MTIELWVLMISVGVLMAGIIFQTFSGLFAFGFLKQLGARDEAREPQKYLGRATRAVQNQLESLAMFAPVVLTAHLVDVHTAMTANGALLYGLARLAYMPAYWLGLPFVRSIIFTAGLVGTLMVALPILLGQ